MAGGNSIGPVIKVEGEAEFRKSINGINDNLKTLKTELATVTSSFDKNDKSQEALTKQNEVLTKQIELQRKKVEECNSMLAKATDKYGETNKATLAWQRTVNASVTDLNKLERQLATNNTELAVQGNAFTALGAKFDATGGKLTTLSEGFTKSGKTLTMGVTTPLVALGAVALNSGMDFESAMSKVRAISGATGDDFEKLNKLALQLGEDTAFSASEAANGMENLASAGFNVTEIVSAMPGMLDLAAAGGLDVASASDIASSALRAFGLDASQSGHLADVFAEAAGATNANVTDMGESLKYAATPAYALGMSVEETSAAIGELANVGIKGSEAGTSLRGALISLASPSDEAASAMESIGFSAFDAEGKMLPFNEVIGNLQSSLGGLSQEEKTNAVATIFGREAMSGMLALVEAGPDQYTNLTKSLETCDGAASDMAKTMQDNAKSSIEQMMGSLETAAIKVEEAVAPTVVELTDEVKELAEGFSDLSPEAKKTIIVAVGLAAAIGPVALAIGGVTKVAAGAVVTIKTVIGVIDVLALGATAATPAIAGLSTAITFMTGPVGITIGILAALATGIAVVASSTAKNTEEQKKALQVHDDYIQSNTDLLKSITDSADARKDSTLATEGEAAAAKILADKIFELSEKQNKSAYEMSVLDVWVDQFNGLMPTANMLIDDQTGALNLTKDATYDLINAELQRIQLSAATEALTEITKEQLKIAQQITTGTIEANDAEKKHLDNLDKINNSIKTSEQRTAAINFENQQYGKTLSETQKSMEDLTEQQKSLASEYATYEQFIADPAATQEYIKNAGMTVTNTDGSIKDINTLWAEYMANTPNTTGAAGTAAANEFKKSMDAETPAISATAQTWHDAVVDKTSPLPAELYATGSEGALGLGSSLGAGTQWIGINANIVHDTAKEAMDPLPSELGAIGTDSMVKTGAGIDVGAPVVNAAAQGIFDVITGRLNPLGQFGQDTGESVNAGLRGGMEDHEAIDLSVGGIVQWVLDAFNIGFDIHSPAKKMHPIGVNVLKGLFVGMNSLDIGGFADGLIQRLLDAFNAGKVSALSIFNSMGDEGASLLERMGISLGISGGNLPVDGSISSYFGYRDDVEGVGTSDHMGVDIAAAEGTPIYAAEGGTVSESSGSGYGNLIIIDNGAGLVEYYGHMSGFNVADGATVKKGELIGFVGSTGNSTGPHLHFGVLKDGEWVDPLAYYGGYATGTDCATPGLHWVGEHGRELVSFSGGEKVYTNEESTAMVDQAQAKQPIIINLVLQNGTKLAEYLIDDINNMLGVKTGLSGRGMA